MYWEADIAGALATVQVPSWETDPTTLMVSPYAVVMDSWKVMATFAPLVAVEVAEVVVPVAVVVVLVEVDSVDDGWVEPVPPMAMSAHER